MKSLRENTINLKPKYEKSLSKKPQKINNFISKEVRKENEKNLNKKEPSVNALKTNKSVSKIKSKI